MDMESPRVGSHTGSAAGHQGPIRGMCAVTTPSVSVGAWKEGHRAGSGGRASTQTMPLPVVQVRCRAGGKPPPEVCVVFASSSHSQGAENGSLSREN